MMRFILSFFLLTNILVISAQNMPERESGFRYPDKMRIYDSVMAATVPEIKVLPGMLKTSLPGIVDNSHNSCFSGILDQRSFFSCQQYAGVAYTYAYEENRLRGLDGTLPENRYSTHYTWTMMNDGEVYTGVSFFYSWDVIRQQGVPAISDFGPDTSSSYTGWMSGYGKYYNGMHNRLNSISSIPVNTEQGVLTLKNWLFDHLEGSPVGGIACFSASSCFTGNLAIIPPGEPEAGKSVLTAFYPNATHGMTIVGYNETVRYDVNGDGQYTDNIDITGDGIVDLRDRENGAWIIANSYGTWWSNQGFFYALYRALALDYDYPGGGWTADNGVWNHCVYVIQADPDYTPLLTAKVDVTYNQRSKLRITAGLSTDTAQQLPRHLMEFPVFSFQGGQLPMKGFTQDPSDQDLELGLDITPLLSWAEPGKPCKLFLNIEERDPDHTGNGTVNHVSFIDYSNGTNEIVSTRADVQIPDNNTLFVPAIATVGFDNVSVATDFLPGYVSGENYEVQLNATGGTPPYSWSLKRPVIREETSEPFPVVNSIALHPYSTYISWTKLALPFPFPFMGNNYDTIWVNAFGFISFDGQMLPYPYLTDEEGMIRRNRVISPAFSMRWLIRPPSNQVFWADIQPTAVTIRWKLSDYEYQNTSENNFALRLNADGSFEFLYGDLSNPDAPVVTRSGYSAGDENNSDTWTNWEFDGLSGKSFSFHPDVLPDGVSLSPGGMLDVTSADSSVIYELPVSVTDAYGISSEKILDLSTGLQIRYSIKSANGKLQFGEPASLLLTVSNHSGETLHDLTLTLSSSDTAINISDSVVQIPLLDPGSEMELDSAFSFALTCRMPDLYNVPFSIEGTCSSHDWIKHFRIPVSSYMIEAEAPVVDDGYNGILDPGEVAWLRFRIDNLGSLGIDGINVHLEPMDTLVSILSSPDLEIDHLNSFSSTTLDFQVKATRFILPGETANLILTLERQPGLDMEVPVQLRLGKVPVAVISMSPVSDSPERMAEVLDSLRISYRNLDTIPVSLDEYSAVFLILGTVSPGSHELTQEEGSLLAGYLNKHGNLYLESYHTWFFGPKTEVHPLFNYTSDRVPLFRYQHVYGVDGTFTEGMLYPFTASWNFSVFNYNPVSPAYTIFKNPDGESLEIAHSDSNFKTIGTFVEFGKFADTSGTSTRGELMKRYLEFFGIPLGGPYALFHSDKNVVHRNESVGMFDDSFENIVSWQWEFPGGSPSASSEKNPVVVYPDFGKYDVRLTVSDGEDTASILKKGYISVVPGLGIEEAKVQSWFTVYPNPSDGLIRLAFSEGSCEPVTIRVFDLMGRMILQKRIHVIQAGEVQTINLSASGKGVYILRVSTGSGDKSSLVVVR